MTVVFEGKLPKVKTELPGPESRRILELDARYVSPSYTRSYPLVARRGRGALVEDMDGNVFLDFAAGIAVVATGHCHLEVVRAIQQQAEELLHISPTDFYEPRLVELCEKIQKITPGSFPKRIFFSNSGTEAIEAGLKLARYATGRSLFIAFHGCFHGRTYGALSLTSSKPVQRHRFGPLLPGVVHAPFAYPYRSPHPQDPKACAEHALSYITDTLFHTSVNPQEVAAIVVEPIQGEGGYVIPPREFLQGLEGICREHGILLMVDEVQTGMGRTGRWWASEHFGITPDILCIAKGVASGLPLGLTVARADLMTWPPGAHASTFGGNPLSLVAAMATIRLIEQKYGENAQRMGDYILKRLTDWPGRHRLVGEVRGLGLMIALELVRNKKTKELASAERDRVVEGCFRRGLLVLGSGRTVLRLMPPLVIDEEQADCALRVLDEVLTEVEAG